MYDIIFLGRHTLFPYFAIEIQWCVKRKRKRKIRNFRRKIIFDLTMTICIYRYTLQNPLHSLFCSRGLPYRIILKTLNMVHIALIFFSEQGPIRKIMGLPWLLNRCNSLTYTSYDFHTWVICIRIKGLVVCKVLLNLKWDMAPSRQSEILS